MTDQTFLQILNIKYRERHLHRYDEGSAPMQETQVRKDGALELPSAGKQTTKIMKVMRKVTKAERDGI